MVPVFGGGLADGNVRGRASDSLSHCLRPVSGRFPLEEAGKHTDTLSVHRLHRPLRVSDLESSETAPGGLDVGCRYCGIVEAETEEGCGREEEGGEEEPGPGGGKGGGKGSRHGARQLDDRQLEEFVSHLAIRQCR